MKSEVNRRKTDMKIEQMNPLANVHPFNFFFNPYGNMATHVQGPYVANSDQNCNALAKLLPMLAKISCWQHYFQFL